MWTSEYKVQLTSVTLPKECPSAVYPPHWSVGDSVSSSTCSLRMAPGARWPLGSASQSLPWSREQNPQNEGTSGWDSHTPPRARAQHYVSFHNKKHKLNSLMPFSKGKLKPYLTGPAHAALRVVCALLWPSLLGAHRSVDRGVLRFPSLADFELKYKIYNIFLK